MTGTIVNLKPHQDNHMFHFHTNLTTNHTRLANHHPHSNVVYGSYQYILAAYLKLSLTACRNATFTKIQGLYKLTY